LEQSTDSDVLSAPSLTTVDGKEAQIWVGEDRRVPKSFEAKSADISVHVEHKGWTSKLIGVHFKVTPSILSPDLIKLNLNPKVVDLIGYDTYQVSPGNTTMLMVNGGFVNQTIVQGQYPILNAPERRCQWRCCCTIVSSWRRRCRNNERHRRRSGRSNSRWEGRNSRQLSSTQGSMDSVGTGTLRRRRLDVVDSIST